jgi:acyl-coenzyme A thioesterase PaaI-like protein
VPDEPVPDASQPDSGEPVRPASSWRLAQELGDTLPLTDDVANPSALALVAEIRALMDAAVVTDVSADERARIAAELTAISARLTQARRPDGPLLTRRPDGMLQHLTNAGSGRLNPHAPLVEFIDLPAAPPPGTEPYTVEVHARCTFTEAHAGSPARVHGGPVMSVLDEALGMAVTVAGASGMTVEITVRFRAGTPVGMPVDLRARFTHREGRKAWATGELLVDGVIAAEATALYISEK